MTTSGASISVPLVRRTDTREFQRRFQFVVFVLRRPEFGRLEKRSQHFANVAVGILKGGRHFLYQRFGRVVGDKTLGELFRNEVRGGRRVREHVEDVHAFLLAAVVDGLLQNCFIAGLVALGIELKLAAVVGLRDGPSGEDAREFGNVILRVAAIHSERVQLHQFAAVIFVQPTLIFTFSPRRRNAGRC